MMKPAIISWVGHVVRLNNGVIFRPSGQVCRLSRAIYEGRGLIRVKRLGEPRLYTLLADGSLSEESAPLPEPQDGVLYIVSGLVARQAHRPDFVVPAVHHSHAIQDDRGKIRSVPFLIQEAA